MSAKISGTVKDGVVVPDEPLELPDGATVLIQVPLREWLRKFAGIWKDDPYWEQFAREWPNSRTSSPGIEL